MNVLLVKQLLKEQIIDFDRMIKKSYKAIGLKEVEAIFLMELHTLTEKNVKSINPTVIASYLSLDEEEAANLLDSMMQRGYLSFVLSENKQGVMTESISLDQTIKKILTYYQQQVDEAIVKTQHESDTDESEIAEILEIQLQRQLKPLEVEVIIKWIHEYHYQKNDIKAAIIDAVKAGRTSISYIDNVLLKKSKNQVGKTIKTNRKKSKILQDFLES